MIRLIEGVFSKILGLATLKYFKSGTYYISSASPIRTTAFLCKSGLLLRSLFKNEHHVSLDILTFKETTTGCIQDYQFRRPQTKQNPWLYFARA